VGIPTDLLTPITILISDWRMIVDERLHLLSREISQLSTPPTWLSHGASTLPDSPGSTRATTHHSATSARSIEVHTRAWPPIHLELWHWFT
jgi:hypothetical protein